MAASVVIVPPMPSRGRALRPGKGCALRGKALVQERLRAVAGPGQSAPAGARRRPAGSRPAARSPPRRPAPSTRRRCPGRARAPRPRRPGRPGPPPPRRRARPPRGRSAPAGARAAPPRFSASRTARGGKGVDALDSPAPRKGAEALHRLHGPLHGLLLQAARLHALAQARRLQELLRPSRLDEQQAHRIAPHVDHRGVPHLSSPPLFSRLLHKKDRIPRGMRVLFTFRPGSRFPPAGPWALFRPPARSTPPLPPRPPLR